MLNKLCLVISSSFGLSASLLSASSFRSPSGSLWIPSSSVVASLLWQEKIELSSSEILSPSKPSLILLTSVQSFPSTISFIRWSSFWGLIKSLVNKCLSVGGSCPSSLSGLHLWRIILPGQGEPVMGLLVKFGISPLSRTGLRHPCTGLVQKTYCSWSLLGLWSCPMEITLIPAVRLWHWICLRRIFTSTGLGGTIMEKSGEFSYLTNKMSCRYRKLKYWEVSGSLKELEGI